VSNRRRWFSARAVKLHAIVLVVAPGCVLAGWWQATRALAGNGLSWFYSVEWPVFALLAVAGWWHLVHEDPDELRARRAAGRIGGAAADRPVAPPGDHATPRAPGAAAITAPPARLAAAAAPLPAQRLTGRPVPAEVRLAAAIELAIAAQLALGIAALALVPYHRASGLLPGRGAAVYVAHASLGPPLAAAAGAFLTRSRRGGRVARAASWTGVSGIALAGAGGLLSMLAGARLPGLGLMLLGTVVAGIGFAFPILHHLELRDVPPVETPEPPPPPDGPRPRVRAGE
jgi:hypothetical protein